MPIPFGSEPGKPDEMPDDKDALHTWSDVRGFIKAADEQIQRSLLGENEGDKTDSQRGSIDKKGD